FNGLDGADDTGQHAQYACLCTAGNQPGGRGLRKQVPVVGPAGSLSVHIVENGNLPFELENGAVDIRFVEHHAGIIDQVARGEVVGAVSYHIVIPDNFQRIFTGQPRLMPVDGNMRINLLQPLFSDFHLGAAVVGSSKQYLPVQVAGFNGIKVNQSDGAYARRGQILQHACSQPARSNSYNFGSLQLRLALDAQLRNRWLPAVVSEFFTRIFYVFPIIHFVCVT